jgi:thiamine kinase-like enzyme
MIKLVNYIELFDSSFPKEILKDTREYLNNFEAFYSKMSSCGRTLCHGDFAYVNMKINKGQLKLFDWELAGYYNPEHDLIHFLLNGKSSLLDDAYIINVIKTYYCYSKFRKYKPEYQDIMLMNLHLVFLSCLSWIFILKSDYYIVPKVKRNFIVLNRFLKQNNLIELLEEGV